MKTNQPETKITTHIISGGNFHGEYSFTLRGPAEGFRLSKNQERKVDKKLCGIPDCKCGGGYGRGADEDSARLEGDYDRTFLITPAEIQQRRAAEAAWAVWWSTSSRW